jgi:hypothetical protein
MAVVRGDTWALLVVPPKAARAEAALSAVDHLIQTTFLWVYTAQGVGLERSIHMQVVLRGVLWKSLQPLNLGVMDVWSMIHTLDVFEHGACLAFGHLIYDLIDGLHAEVCGSLLL